MLERQIMNSLDILKMAADEAENANIRFGQVAEVAGRLVALTKGKPDFDPDLHERSYKEITIRVDPLPESGQSNFIKREMIAEFAGWTRITYPSIIALVKKNWWEIDGQWVKYELVEEPKKKGSDFVSTTFKFLALYADHAACLSAYEALRGEVVHTEGDDAMAIDMTPGAVAPAVDNAEKQTARLFLDALRTQHTDPAALATAISGMPMIAKFFAVQDGRVVEVAA
jgi:hypothetical protein